ncbi:hypothetical protein QWY28_17355 [Nocardioides sp. SOB77]|uniref:HK97 gp10 family phage protein n=1 Tax=Nocardioides oceani TaxID=3058369 RepID=A0ABT8FKS3_9ACTN|nr:hypothetical protein [Nocardioides oceani]MDN4174732.1 hypothetical protein [Nocardioides oceani]
MGVHIDASEVDRLAVDMRGAPLRLQRKARGVMKRGALEIKRGMQDDFSGHRYAGAVPASIEFEQRDAAGLAYEIGELDSAGPQWGLAAILAFGTSNNAPVVDHTAALRGEAPEIARHLGDAAEDSVLGGAE